MCNEKGIQNEKCCYEESSQFLKVKGIAFFTFRQKNFSLAYQVRSEEKVWRIPIEVVQIPCMSDIIKNDCLIILWRLVFM
jgi:hypothetical protein